MQAVRFRVVFVALAAGACSQVLGYDDVDFNGTGGTTPTGGGAGVDGSAGAGAGGTSGAGGAVTGGAGGVVTGGAGGVVTGGAGGVVTGGTGGIVTGGTGGVVTGGTGGVVTGGTGGVVTGGTGGVVTGGTGGTTSGGTGGTTSGGTGGTATGGTGGTATGGTGGTATGGTGGTATGGTGGTATGGTGGTGGTCTAGVTEKSVAVSSPPGSPLYGAVMPSGDTAVAWASGGNVYVTRANAAGTKLGADFSVPGLHVHGFTASSDGFAMLVARNPDNMFFVKLNASGTVVANKELTGSCNHATIGCEWYSYSATFYADGGRLLFTGTNYRAYFPIYRRWPDNIAHTGDTLRTLDLSGNQQSGGWSWGCSHSLDVRLAMSGSTVGPVCLSDCYAQKAILWSDSKVISSEPSGNCGGYSNAALGGFVPVSGGFWLTYISPEGRPSKDVAVAKIDTSGNVSTKVWLTNDSTDQDSAHLALFKNRMIAAWKTGTTRTLQELDITTGNPVGSPVTVTSAFRAKDDFFTYPNGDVGWVYGSGSNVVIARYTTCP